MIVVPLHGRTVGEEDNVQVALFASVCFLLCGCKLVDSIHRVVVVCTRCIVQRVGSCEVFNGNERACIHCFCARVDLRFGVSIVRNFIGHHISSIAVIRGASGVMVLAIESVKVCDCYIDIKQLSVVTRFRKKRDEV